MHDVLSLLPLRRDLYHINLLAGEHGDAGDSVPEADIQGLVPELDEELSFYDDNNDGLINYAEFMINHKKRIQA